MEKVLILGLVFMVLLSGCIQEGMETPASEETTAPTTEVETPIPEETTSPTTTEPTTINNFEECADAGHPVMESYPRQCKTPDGRTFTEDVEPTETIAPTETPAPSEAPPETVPPTTVVDANNEFAFDLYSNLKEVEEGNIFFSPYSISTALAMTYEGARGQTAEEMQSVFHFPDDDSTRRSSFAAIHDRLNEPDVEYELCTANALWAQKDYSLLDEYIETIERYYAGKATNLDFVGEGEQSRQTINSWVEEKTNDKINDLFPPGSLNPDTRLVITNAIYFKGTWVKQFDEKETREEDFRMGPDDVVQVPMMRLVDKDTKFNYAENDEMQILEMPYEGEDLSMLVLLPKNDSLKALEDSLTLEKLNQWKNDLKEQRVDVYMPKFTFESKYFLNENLKEMGMPSAFEQSVADFSGMDGTRDLLIHLVVHQAFVDVNEEGTEAAAATGVSMGIISVPPPIPIFRADHPFIFLIQERNSGNILFLGRVVDPR